MLALIWDSTILYFVIDQFDVWVKVKDYPITNTDASYTRHCTHWCMAHHSVHTHLLPTSKYIPSPPSPRNTSPSASSGMRIWWRQSYFFCHLSSRAVRTLRVFGCQQISADTGAKFKCLTLQIPANTFVQIFLQIDQQQVVTLLHSHVNPTGLALWVFCLIILIVTETEPEQ